MGQRVRKAGRTVDQTMMFEYVIALFLLAVLRRLVHLP
jgi:hypothetical protein